MAMQLDTGQRRGEFQIHPLPFQSLTTYRWEDKAGTLTTRLHRFQKYTNNTSVRYPLLEPTPIPEVNDSPAWQRTNALDPWHTIVEQWMEYHPYGKLWTASDCDKVFIATAVAEMLHFVAV